MIPICIMSFLNRIGTIENYTYSITGKRYCNTPTLGKPSCQVKPLNMLPRMTAPITSKFSRKRSCSARIFTGALWTFHNNLVKWLSYVYKNITTTKQFGKHLSCFKEHLASNMWPLIISSSVSLGFSRIPHWSEESQELNQEPSTTAIFRWHHHIADTAAMWWC